MALHLGPRQYRHKHDNIAAQLHISIAKRFLAGACLGHFGVDHVLVVVDDHVGKGHHVARQEVRAPALLAPKVSQVVQRVHP
jgi:hypothetical protein